MRYIHKLYLLVCISKPSYKLEASSIKFRKRFRRNIRSLGTSIAYSLLEKAMAPHSSTPAWKIPWMEEPGGLQSRGCWGSDMSERLHFHCSLSRIGEGNGNPLQCSCLENPRDGGAWWAAVYGVAQSRTRLKWLSSIAYSLQDIS